jgi:pimeloyl-ACP methyl ester carboxylesterase
MVRTLINMIYSIGTVLIVGISLILSLGYFFQEKLLFLPSKLSSNHIFNFDVQFKELEFTMDDQVKLHGIMFPVIESKGLILYLHGNAGSVEDWGRISPYYVDVSYDLFILDYRGFGKSEGRIQSEEQFFSDARTVYQHFVEDYGEENIIVVGYSIGTAPAAMLASHFNPAKVVLKAPFYNLMDIKRRYYPFLPDFLMRYAFENNIYLKETESQIIIYHGTHDEIIPNESSALLRPLLKPGDHYIILPNQTHNGMNRNPDFHNSFRELVIEF